MPEPSRPPGEPRRVDPSRPRRPDPMLRRARRRRERAVADQEVDAAPQDPDEERDAPAGRGRAAALLAAFLRPSRHQVVLGLVLGLVAMGMVVQLRSQSADDTYATARRADLIQLLDGLSAESRRLEDELATLEQTRRELETGADSQRVAREQAGERLEELSILAGTTPAEGPGVRLRIVDPLDQVDAQVMLNAVEELRDAGAEVIEIDDSVRVGTSTWFGTGPDGLLVDGQPVASPIVIEAIGDPHALEEAVRFRGGLVSEITGPQVQGQVEVVQLGLVEVDSVRAPTAFQHAEPVPPR
ncbi:DUF881 domain-containing protein [Auraticoccus monumenti]|uniref:Uncharacterized conserved protein YlxW, UPF0749 family n=1 Tax=Auraticoccus monumenti TaxID=675864 RepID=A0A1G7C1C9_9ACTN|nr:DUF881 domain-containing protein [Auraticoccus monumenti]SDE33164.1 Uncharacterized conserved protein YlxW, UPF0749 family [Auraticoccus monumenti]